MDYKNNPYLRKHCKTEHNISRKCNTIRLGTLYEYREIEDEHLRDEEEGKISITVEFESPRLIPGSLLNKINRLDNIHLDLKGNNCKFTEDGIITQGLSLDSEVRDAWIFCISQVDEVIPKETSTNYDSSWEFPILHAGRFALMIREMLCRQITNENLIESVGEPFISNPGMRWTMASMHAPVDYGGRVVKISDNTALDDRFIFDLCNSVYFRKPEKFKDEKEYRFVFHEHIPEVSVKKKIPFIISIDDVNVILRYIGAKMRSI